MKHSNFVFTEKLRVPSIENINHYLNFVKIILKIGENLSFEEKISNLMSL